MSSASFARWQIFHLVKVGNAPADYEDAFAADNDGTCFAVADGASEASFAGLWARLLTDGFVRTRKAWRNLDWLAPIRQRWATEVDALPLPWYAEAKREQGGFATLLGLAFRAPEAGRPGLWRALAIGDSCLFRIKGDRLRTSFPLTQSAEFGNQPRLLGSRPSADRIERSDRAGGRWRPGDRFLLMTDALAQWFLQQLEQDAQPTARIAGLLAQADPQAAFPAWIEERRSAEGMRNDDITLLVIDL